LVKVCAAISISPPALMAVLFLNLTLWLSAFCYYDRTEDNKGRIFGKVGDRLL